MAFEMKRILSTIALVAFVATAFVSCDKSEVEAPEMGVKMKTITVKADISTKTTLDANHENIIWSSGDVVKLFNDADTTSLRMPYVAGGAIEIQVPEATTEIYAHYPYFNGNNKGPKEVSIYIPKAQKQTNPGELNGYNYPMVAKGTVSADNKALISLYPVASALALNIYNTELSGEEEEQVLSVTVTPTNNTGFNGSQVTDITADVIKYTTAKVSDPITVTLTNPLTLGNTKPADKQKFDGQIYVCLAKQSYANVKFEIQTDKGTYTITSNSTPFDCVNNDFVPVNINLKNATFEKVEFADGLYAISTSYEGTEYMMVANNTGKVQSYTEMSTATDDSGVLIVAPEAAWKLTYDSENENYSLQSFEYGLFFGELGDKTDLKLVSQENKDVFTITKHNDGYHINSSYGRWIAYNYNSGSPRFGMYSNDENFPGIVKITPVKTTAVSSITFSETEREVSAAMESVDFSYIGKYLSSLPRVRVKEGSAPIIAENGITVFVDKITISLIPNEDNTDKQATLIIESDDVPNIPELVIVQKAKSEDGQVAPANTVLWAETWTGATTATSPSDNATPSSNYGHGTIVWNGGTITYKQSANTVYVRNENTGGGTAPELLLSGNNTWTVSSIPTGGAKKLSLTWSSNNTKTTVSISPAEAKISGSSKNYTIEPNGVENINLVFSSSSNSRLDNVELKVTEAGDDAPIIPTTVTGISVEDYTETFTASETGTYAFDGKVYAVYSDESKSQLSASDYNVSGAVDLTTPNNYTLTVSATIDGETYSEQIVIKVEESTGGDTVVYTLTPDTGSNNSYAGNCDVTINGITWNVTGNAQTIPWRIGGKSLSGVDRVVYSKTALNKNISKIDITHGNASSITVNSMTIIVSKNVDFSSPVSTLTPTFAANSTITVNRPEGADWTDCYYKIVYNVTVSGTSNKFLEFTEAKFTGK